MGSFYISDKDENNNPISTSLCLVENINVQGEYYKVPVADLNKGYLNGILIDDTNKADGFVLSYNQSENKFEYTEAGTGGGGTTVVPFSETVVFDGDQVSLAVTQTADLNISPDINTSNHSDEGTIKLTVDGNSSNSIDVSGCKVKGDTPDNTMRNNFYFEYTKSSGTVEENTICVVDVRALPSGASAPFYSNGVVQDAAKSSLIVTFNQSVNISDLTGLSLPFSIGTPKTLVSVLGTGTTILTFTLSGDIAFGDVFTFDYDGTNTITAVSGGLPLAANSGSVTNNVGAPVATPVFQSAEVGLVSDTSLTILSDVNCDWGLLGVSINASGGAATLSSPSGNGTTTGSYVISRAIENGETITIDIAGTNGIVNSIDGLTQMTSVVGGAVTNNVSAVNKPNFSSAEIGSISGNKITIVSDILADFTHVAGGILLTSDGDALSITGSDGETNVTNGVFTLDRPVGGGETITLEITGTNGIFATGTASNMNTTSGEIVENNLLGTTIPVGIYDFENDDITDTSGHGNDGTPANITFSGDSQYGSRAAVFGTNNGKIDTPVGTTGNFSVIMVVKVPSQSGALRTISSFTGSTFPDNYFAINDGGPYTQIWGDGDNFTSGDITSTYGNYMMIGCSVNGTTGVTKLYVNDVIPVEMTNTSIAPVGNFIFGTYSGNAQYLNSTVDSIRFYDEIITDAEWTSIYNIKFP